MSKGVIGIKKFEEKLRKSSKSLPEQFSLLTNSIIRLGWEIKLSQEKLSVFKKVRGEIEEQIKKKVNFQNN